MTSPSPKQQTIIKLDQFHQKLSQHLRQLTLNKQLRPKSRQFILYNPKIIDSSTQTSLDKPLIHTTFDQNLKRQENTQQRAKRNLELKQIVQVNFRQYFRTAKQKQSALVNELSELKHINQQLQAECAKKEKEISHLNQKLSVSELARQKPFDQLKKQKLQMEKQHQTDLSTIKNLQKGISEFQEQVRRLSSLISNKDTEIQSQLRKAREFQALYKNSDHLVEVMSKQEANLSAKISKLEKELRQKTHYIEYIEDLYIGCEKQVVSLKQQIDYFSVQNSVYENKVKDLYQDIAVYEQIIRLYENLYLRYGVSHINQEQLCNTSNGIIHQNQQRTDSSQNTIQSDRLTGRHYLNYLQSQNQQLFIEAEYQHQLIKATSQNQKSSLENKLQIQSAQKNLLKRQLALLKHKHQHFINLIFAPSLCHNQYDDSLDSLSSSSYQSLEPLQQLTGTPEQPDSLSSLPQEQDPTPYVQTPHLTLNKDQMGHKQNQLRIHDPERIVSEFLQEEEYHISKENQKNKLIPNKNFERPPSFGNDTDYLSPYDSQNSTPNFTEISVTDSNLNSEVTDNNDMTKPNDESELPLSIQANQIKQDSCITQLPLNFKISKSQKVLQISCQLICPTNEKQKTFQDKFDSEDIAIQTNTHQEKENHTQSDTKTLPECKQAYCQATNEQNLSQIADRQKQGVKFIKKHQSMTNCNGPQHLSPLNQKQQSECPFVGDKKKNAKKRLDYKLLPMQRAKTALNDLQKQTGNIHTHNIIYRRIEKQKNTKFIACSKLADRLSELIHKQSNLQLQLSTLQNQQNYQSLGLLGTNNVKQNDNQNTHLFISEELEVMGELQKVIHDAFEWVMLIDRHHKREFEKNDRLGGRVRLKKVKTGVNHHNKTKQKESNEDCYETNRLFEWEKEKTVLSEGDSPPGAGDIDHFDFNPFDNIDVQQKHEYNHSLQKMFREGQEISQISSVKNQSQVSYFTNEHSEIVKMFGPHSFVRVDEDEARPNAASAFHEGMELHSPNQFHQGISSLAFNSLGARINPYFTHQNGIHDSAVHHHVRFEDNSIKSLRNICSKEKEKVKMLEKKVVEITSMYKKFIEKIVEDDKKKMLKIQKDFNKALSMAINLNEPIIISHISSSPSNPKQAETSNPATSIKLLPPSEQRSPLPSVKTVVSKLQSRSLTQITLMSQKINEKDQILQEKIEGYEKRIDELMLKVDELKANINSKGEQIEQLERKNKAERLQTQKVEKRLQQQLKEVQSLKTQNKRIKNEFSQFMAKLVTQQKHEGPPIRFIKRPSYEEQLKVMKDIEMQVPEVVLFADTVSKQEAHSISPPSEISFDKKDDLDQVEDVVGQKNVVYARVISLDKGDTNNEKRGQELDVKDINTTLQQQQEHNQIINDKPQQQLDQLILQFNCKDKTIEEMNLTIQQQSTQIIALEQQLNQQQLSNSQLNDQIDLISIELEQKQVQLNELQNSLNSLKNFETRINLKLQQAEKKNLFLEEQLKKQNQSISTPNKNPSPPSNKQHFVTPISKLSHQGDNLPVENNKSNRGSMGSVEQNFFDLQTQNEFNNIQTHHIHEKDLRILQLEKQLAQTNKKLQIESSQNHKLKSKILQ